MKSRLEARRIMKSSGSKAKIGALFILLVILSFALGACWGLPTLHITVHNQTDETLQIFNRGELFIGAVVPGGEVKFETGAIYPHYSITAKDVDGNTVYTANFTQDDIAKKNYKYDVYFPAKVAETENSDNITGE